jgi:hypothetical protein
MRLLNRKSQTQRLLDTVGDSLEVPSALKSGPPAKAVKATLIAAGGLAGLTAGSAGISSLRHKREGASDGS